MTTIELNEKKYTIPSNFDELPFKDYVRIFQGISGKKEDSIEDKLLVISHLLNEPKETIEQLPVTVFNRLFDEVCWIFDNPDYQPTDTVTIDGWIYTITPIEKFPFRKYIDCEEIANGGNDGYTRLLGTILTDNDQYTQDKAEELTKKIDEQPTSTMLPLMTFFLLRQKLSETNSLLSSIVKELEEIVLSAKKPEK